MESYMRLHKALIKIIDVDLEKVFRKEDTDPEYLNRKLFNNSTERATAGIMDGVKRAINVLALADAKSAEDKDGMDTLNEQVALMADMDGEDVAIGTTSYWKP